jgi:hypothetical protein
MGYQNQTNGGEKETEIENLFHERNHFWLEKKEQADPVCRISGFMETSQCAY